MILVPLSGTAVLIYLALNILFGTLGHAGVEPFPESWRRRQLLREIGSSSFHARHHRTLTTNYGFYTLAWDRLFGTLAK
jgi:sterol desaturase/sphingolipid hydroxylase (fatty acid hydroxylase superfamily)